MIVVLHKHASIDVALMEGSHAERDNREDPILFFFLPIIILSRIIMFNPADIFPRVSAVCTQGVCGHKRTMKHFTMEAWSLIKETGVETFKNCLQIEVHSSNAYL
uniref:Uncharacterized protein n=1 Tax=Cacopsylla melanoneura TaxID=428564 RepID=A0A8D8T641_9HEMI